MTTRADLRNFYDFWVNGQTLSSWQLVAARPSAPPTLFNPTKVTSDNKKMVLELSNYSQKRDLRLDINASNLLPVYQMILHGSQATSDTCDFSDVDVLVVLDDSRAFSSAQHYQAVSELKALLRSIFLYDCLMHHGFMFMLRSDFEAYQESFLPVDTLKNAAVIYGPLFVSLRRALPEAWILKKRLESSAQSLARRLERRDHERNDYSFKSVLSGLLLMPSLLLETKNIFCYKRDSFSVGPREFPDFNWRAIKQAEQLRLRWKRPRTPFVQNIVSKMSHPYSIIRITRGHPPRVNVEALLGGHDDAFVRSCKEFLDCLISL